MKRTVIACFALAVLSLGAVFIYNHLRLQVPADEVIRNTPAGQGIVVRTHFGHYVDTSVLIFDLVSVSRTNNLADVFHLFIRFAEKMKGLSFREVRLACGGRVRFRVSGEYFRSLGAENAWKDPVKVMRTFPEHLLAEKEGRAYPRREGDQLTQVKMQMKDFYDCHERWYMKDLVP